MQMVTIGTKNQVVIPKAVRKRVDGLIPGKKIGVYQTDKNTIILKTSPEDWVESTYGIMKKAWKGRDIIKELEKIRNEW